MSKAKRNSRTRHPSIPVEQRGMYARTAATLFERMTPTALLRLRQNTREVRFYASLEEMTVELAATEEKVRAVLTRGGTIGGAYQHATRCLNLNGGDDEAEDRDCYGLYAHEFGHAIDGPGHGISGSHVWRAAWAKEIVPPPLSRRARINAHEGFAEFGRVLYTGTVSRKQLAKDLPQCVEVWKGHGLW